MSLSRRTFLRGAGIAMSLPMLDAMIPAFRRKTLAAEVSSKPPRRMIAIQTNMGILAQHFFPTATGADFELTAYLDLLKDFKSKMTVCSGVSHPDIESAQFKVLSEFLAGLNAIQEGGEPLLDRTMVLYGAPMGNAASHDNKNLPVLLLGGGFKHGGHLAFDHKKNYPLPNLYLSMLQRMGLPIDKFATSTGTMRGLDFS